jgi:hypothetical protein
MPNLSAMNVAVQLERKSIVTVKVLVTLALPPSLSCVLHARDRHISTESLDTPMTLSLLPQRLYLLRPVTPSGCSDYIFSRVESSLLLTVRSALELPRQHLSGFGFFHDVSAMALELPKLEPQHCLCVHLRRRSVSQFSHSNLH